jgi:LmbE family N-acetylglucosaminyl deacetylase
MLQQGDERMRILGQKILFVTAHPDDESYMAAGTMRRNDAAGGRSYVACATFGERGRSHIKGKVTKRELRMVRKKELRAASRFLRVSALLTPGLPDTEMGEARHREAFYEKLLVFAQKHHPDLVIGFGTDGISGHVDHIAVGRVARRVAGKLKVPFLAVAPPPGFDKYLKQMKGRRRHGRYARTFKHVHHDFRIQVDASIKLRALRFHRSQLDGGNPFSGLPPGVAKEFLNHEYFSMRGPHRRKK